MTGDRWEEGGKEKISKVMINSSSDLCGNMRINLSSSKTKAVFSLSMFYFPSLEMEAEQENLRHT